MMSITNMEELQHQFASYRSCVEAMMQEARQQGNTEAMRLLNQIWLRLLQGPVRTLVLGVSSAGKSTLINAVSGSIVVPEGKRTTSPIPVWVYSRNPAKTPRIQILKCEENEVTEIPCGRFTYLTEYCYTSKQAGAGTGQEKYANLVAATVNVDAPALKSSGISLIDTPGIGVSAGDNDRVKEVLKDSCEALIILFMTLQEEDTQTYFRDLLIEDDAPLRDLIEQDRVFLVLNNVKEYARDIAVLDTMRHVKKTFDGWDCGERLYAMNARDARICSCGVYQYDSLLPQDFDAEVLKHAEESLDDELEQVSKAKPQAELDRLCRDLGEMAEQLCADPYALEQILEPIEEKLYRANALLKQHYQAEREIAAAAEYTAPAELEQERKILSEQYYSLQALYSQLCEVKDTLMIYPDKQWPVAEYPKDIPLNSEYLLIDDKSQVDSFLRDELRKNNGPGSIALLVGKRMYDRIQMLCDQLEDPALNPESRYWEEFFSGIYDKLNKVNDCNGLTTAQKKELSECIYRVSMIPKNAKAAGRMKVLQSDCFKINSGERQQMVEYLLKKQKRLLNGGMRGRFESFMLWINFSVDMLNKVLRSIITDANTCYREAYRQCVTREYEDICQTLCQILLAARSSIAHRRREVKNEIQRCKEDMKNKEFSRIDAQLQHLDALMIFEKG